MKLLGGTWSKGDMIALIGVVIALVGVLAAILAIPGMPKFFHSDSEPAVQAGAAIVKTEEASPVSPPRKAIQKNRVVTSGQVNFGCDQTLQVETPVVSFAKNPKDIGADATWVNTDNVKTQNQSVINIEDPTDRHVVAVKGVGSISGRDSQSMLGIKNCPGGGHGELTLRVTWTDDG